MGIVLKVLKESWRNFPDRLMELLDFQVSQRCVYGLLQASMPIT